MEKGTIHQTPNNVHETHFIQINKPYYDSTLPNEKTTSINLIPSV